MIYYFINFRSLTYAQRAEHALKRAGISAFLIRTPQKIAKSGCSHSLKVPDRYFSSALRLLREKEFPFLKVYRLEKTGEYREVMP